MRPGRRATVLTVHHRLVVRGWHLRDRRRVGRCATAAPRTRTASPASNAVPIPEGRAGPSVCRPRAAARAASAWTEGCAPARARTTSACAARSRRVTPKRAGVRAPPRQRRPRSVTASTTTVTGSWTSRSPSASLAEYAADGFGSCPGSTVCLGSGGIVCSGPYPSTEVCDGVDNNCDGNTDESFTDASGQYTTDTNCGACGFDCTGKILHGVGECVGPPNAPSPTCRVKECDPGFVLLGEFQCGVAPDLSCLPCVTNADCLGGSCVSVGGESVCAGPCTTLADCQESYGCADFPGIGKGPSPTAGACSCTAATDGVARLCVEENAAGTCYGAETATLRPDGAVVQRPFRTKRPATGSTTTAMARWTTGYRSAARAMSPPPASALAPASSCASVEPAWSVRAPRPPSKPAITRTTTATGRRTKDREGEGQTRRHGELRDVWQ